jgi:hypothetical protein
MKNTTCSCKKLALFYYLWYFSSILMPYTLEGVTCNEILVWEVNGVFECLIFEIRIQFLFGVRISRFDFFKKLNKI